MLRSPRLEHNAGCQEVASWRKNKSKTPGGGKKKSPKRVQQSDQSTKEQSLPEVDVVVEMFDRCSRTGVGGLSAEMMEAMLGMDDEQTGRMLRMIRSSFAEVVGGDPEMVIEGIRKFVQKGRRRKKDQQEETRAQGTDEREETSGPEEVRTGRGSAGLVGGGMRGVRRTRPVEQEKEKAMEEKENTEKKEDSEAKERNSPQRCRRRKMRRTIGSKWRPNKGAGGSHPRLRWIWRKRRKKRKRKRKRNRQKKRQKSGNGARVSSKARQDSGC